MLEHFCECYSDLSGPILCPVLGSIIPIFIPNSRIRPIRLIGLCASLITFLYSPVPRIQFDPSTAKSQFVESLRWLPYENINLNLGIDGLSFFFVILTTFLIPICILVGWSGMRSYGKEYITASLIREFLMIAVFRMLDPLLFYVLPESVLIPMLCGAEHLLFAGIKLFLCRGLVHSPREAFGKRGSLVRKHSISGRTRPTQLRRTEPDRHIFFGEGTPSSGYLVGPRPAYSGLGLCLFARMDSSSSQFGGVDTLARIRVTATRDKSKGNCTQPGMDVNSSYCEKKSRPATAGGLLPLSSPGSSCRIPKKDCWQQVETFLWPPKKINAGRVKLGRGFENRIRKEFQTFMHAPSYKCCIQVPARRIGKQKPIGTAHITVVVAPHSIFLPNEPFFVLDLEDGRCVRFERHGFNERFFRAGEKRAGGHLPQRKLHCSPPPEKQKIREADDGSSGRSRMMRKSHVRFPEKGVATYWSFDQPPPGYGVRDKERSRQHIRTADLQISLTTEFSERRQIFLWIASFAAFAVKVPMVPVHIWLPEAHVEAPTAGSVILAGIPSKLGTHGFLRFSIPMFPEATLCSTPFIYTPSAIAIIYTSLTTSRQIDLKKIIAYSSVAHMNLVTIGMFSRAAAVRRQQNIAVCSKNKSPLAPRDGSGPYAQATAAPALRSQNRIFVLAFPIHS
ncbi:hypothetical protein V8G54_000113 (mitochondrion) [Vigna mungo]|uniref:NADH-ubiquinone oxidoreductase chain 4 n=1 Tax=Vigna mungo TaxID=3915 RepID=A0AAQ3MKX0_VIGMU